jgi:hypothetical protein
MIINQQNFVSGLMGIELIRRAKEVTERDWGDDVPITLLFSNLGLAIADHYDELSREEQFLVFDVIERGMNAPNTVLSTAVATGLLEAISSRAAKDQVLAKMLGANLGEASRRYLIAWEQWLTGNAELPCYLQKEQPPSR